MDKLYIAKMVNYEIVQDEFDIIIDGITDDAIWYTKDIKIEETCIGKEQIDKYHNSLYSHKYPHVISYSKEHAMTVLIANLLKELNEMDSKMDKIIEALDNSGVFGEGIIEEE